MLDYVNYDSHLRNGLRDFIQIWNVASLLEANFTVNLVPSGEDITELRMREN